MGGYFGVGQTYSKTEFHIANNVFAQGQQIPIIVQSNNSKCSHSIKSFKFKIWRKVEYMLDGKKMETGEYLNGAKVHGCKPKESVRREHSIPIPLVELDGRVPISGTVISSSFSVHYKLRCFVKHASVFEIGQGNCVEFPIRIVSLPDEKMI